MLPQAVRILKPDILDTDSQDTDSLHLHAQGCWPLLQYMAPVRKLLLP